MAVGKQVIFMFMVASFASGGLAFVLAAAASSSSFLMFSVPGFVIGAFFAYKYAVFDKKRMQEEEHRRKRHRH